MVRVSHSETHFAFAAKGTIYVYEIHADKSDKQLLKVRERARGVGDTKRKRKGSEEEMERKNEGINE